MMKTALILFVFSVSFAQASEYECKGERSSFRIRLTEDHSVLEALAEDWSDEFQKAELNADYKPRSQKWKGGALYDFGSDPFGADGSSSIVLSKEILADEEEGDAQYRLLWETYDSDNLTCKKTK